MAAATGGTLASHCEWLASQVLMMAASLVLTARLVRLVATERLGARGSLAVVAELAGAGAAAEAAPEPEHLGA